MTGGDLLGTPVQARPQQNGLGGQHGGQNDLDGVRGPEDEPADAESEGRGDARGAEFQWCLKEGDGQHHAEPHERRGRVDDLSGCRYRSRSGAGRWPRPMDGGTGMIGQQGNPPTSVRLVPFVKPHLCLPTGREPYGGCEDSEDRGGPG